MDEEWIIRREIMDEASLFGDRENGAVEAWLASIEASWLEKYALQPEEVGKAVLLVAMEARACLASRFAGLLEQGMDEALDKVDLEGMEQRWGRTYADIAVDARKLAALRRYAKEYATDFAMGGSKAAVEILLRIRVSKDDEGTRRRVMGYVAETMHLPLSLVAEVAGLPSMEPEPAEPAGGGWMAREEAMRLWSDSRGEGCVEGNPEAVASEEDLARRKRRWLKGMSFRHVVSRGLKTLEEERACWREALAERLEAAGRKHADAEAVADAAASEAERWRTAHWESLLEEGRVEALRSPALEDKAWGFYAKWPSYAADAFMASHVQVFAETHARRQAQAHAEAALGLAPWVGRGVDAKAFCAWAGMPEDVARRFMQAVACTATQARVSLPPRSSSDDFAVQEQSTTE